MKVLLISPLGFAINETTKYSGIERLVWVYAQELNRLGHQVSVWGHGKSIFPQGVSVFPTIPYPNEDMFVLVEARQYQTYQHVLRNFDVIHDFSHGHLASRFNNNLPSVNPFWHAPGEVQYLKSPYNIIGLSHWACREFKKYYFQEAKYQQTIAIDTDIYKIGNRHRGKRFLTLGRMAEEKGNLDAVKFCLKAGVPLDIVGADSDAQYKEQILKLCDGKQIKYCGEVNDNEKIRLLQDCKSLIYATQRPEVSNHKLQEAMLCGAPVIVPNRGAMSEIVEDGVSGYLCNSELEFIQAITHVGKLNPLTSYDKVKNTYDARNVVAGYLELYEKVANGLRWK